MFGGPTEIFFFVKLKIPRMIQIFDQEGSTNGCNLAEILNETTNILIKELTMIKKQFKYKFDLHNFRMELQGSKKNIEENTFDIFINANIVFDNVSLLKYLVNKIGQVSITINNQRVIFEKIVDTTIYEEHNCLLL